MGYFRSYCLFLIGVSLSVGVVTDSYGAEFFRKQSGTVILPPSGSAASVTVTIEAVCMTQSFLVFSSTADDTDPGDFQVGGQITNSTTLTFTRFNNSTAQISIKWQVFEFEGNVSVQRGITILTASPTNVPITAVDLTKSFVIATMSNDGTTLDVNDSFTPNLTTSTNLQLSAATGNVNFAIYWQVVEYQDVVVKKFTTTLTAGTASTTTTITPPITTLSKAFVLSYHTLSGNAFADDLPRTKLTDVNTVTYTRVGTAQNLDFVTYVIEFTDLSTSTRNTQAFASGSIAENVAITASESSGVFGPGNGGRQGSTSHSTDDNTGHVWFTYEITSDTNLLIERDVGTGSTADAPWQIVTFEDQDTSPTTYYSFATGDWESNLSWTFTSDGSFLVPWVPDCSPEGSITLSFAVVMTSP